MSFANSDELPQYSLPTDYGLLATNYGLLTTDSHLVTFVTDDREVQVPVTEDKYLLDAGVEAGLDLPYMCLQGWCTTCAGRVLATPCVGLSGTVDQSEARRIYPEDEAAGFVLLCSAYARTDVRIRTHQKDEMRQHRQARGLPTPRG